MGIGLKVKQLPSPDRGIVNQLPTQVAKHALFIAEVAEDVRVDLLLTAVEHLGETMGTDRLGNWDAC